MKNILRRYVAAGLAFVLLFICACGRNNATEAGKEDNTEVTEKNDESLKADDAKNEVKDDAYDVNKTSYDVIADHIGVYGKANEVSAFDTVNTNYALNINPNNRIKDISELLYGIFFEDINFAADGGLYAEMEIGRASCRERVYDHV